VDAKCLAEVGSAIDVTGDGFPEVIYRSEDLTDWSFVLLQRMGAGAWIELARGSHGSTA
jgi:hypothetical protein